MSMRDTLRKAAGLLIELPPEEPQAKGSTDAELDKLISEMNQTAKKQAGKSSPPAKTKTVEQIVRESDGPNLDEIHVTATAPTSAVAEDGKVDFNAIYQQATLPATPFTAEQTLEMLASLPADLALDMKRQTVGVTLRAIGKSIGATAETIVADAFRKIAALSAFAETIAKETAEKVTREELEIAALLVQVEDKRKSVDLAKKKQSQISKTCDKESERLDEVLEFFSLDVSPSKYAKEPTSQ